MQFVDIFPKLDQLFPKVITGIVYLGLVLVHFYHLFCDSPIFNMAFEDASGFEKVANYVLAPTQYICGGKKVTYDHTTGRYQLENRFDYHDKKLIYTPLATTFFPQSLMLGGIVKTISLISSDVRQRHRGIKNQLRSLEVISKNAYYRSIGLVINDYKKGEPLDFLGHKRRPGDENLLIPEKKALQVIAEILYQNDIPFWMDCGTLLGTYRYGGIIPWDNDLDISVLVEDFDNVMHALNALDRTKYVAQDWSNRIRPGTYIRVYVKETHSHIDIYHMKIDREKQTLTTIISHEDSDWMAAGWKERELAQITPYPYEVVFPLKTAVFDGIEVPVPNDTLTYLQGKYGENLAPVKIYNEETGQYEKDLSHPYWIRPLAH